MQYRFQRRILILKKKIIDLFKSIAISTLISFICFFALNIFVRSIFENVKNINLIIYCINMITYALCFYFVRTKKLDELIATDSKFNPINEAKKYFFTEGRFLLYIYSILVILCEVNSLIVPDGSGAIFVLLCSMFFPFFSSIKIPVLRSILNLLLANIIPLLLFEYYSYKTKKFKY